MVPGLILLFQNCLHIVFKSIFQKQLVWGWHWIHIQCVCVSALGVLYSHSVDWELNCVEILSGECAFQLLFFPFLIIMYFFDGDHCFMFKMITLFRLNVSLSFI